MAMPTDPHRDLASLDPVWDRVRREAEELTAEEPMMASLVHGVILHHRTLESALAYRIAQKLGGREISEMMVREIADQAFAADPEIGAASRADIAAVHDRDPACERFLQPLLYFKGFIAVQAYRIAHWLYREKRFDAAFLFQMRISEAFGVDIHPAARIGRGIMIDHAHSIVIGATAVVGMMSPCSLPSRWAAPGKEGGDRHPKIGNGVLIGAGAKVLGNIRIGDCSRIAAGSVVLKAVPDCKTVAACRRRSSAMRAASIRASPWIIGFPRTSSPTADREGETRCRAPLPGAGACPPRQPATSPTLADVAAASPAAWPTHGRWRAGASIMAPWRSPGREARGQCLRIDAAGRPVLLPARVPLTIRWMLP